MTIHGLNILDPLASWPVGVKHIRLWDCGVAWKDLNPAEDVYHWDRLDAIVAKAEMRGVKSICLVLSGTPAWAASNPEAPHYASWIGPGSNSPPASMATWEKFVWTVSDRYRGRIRYYEIWNEPMLADFWYPYQRISLLGKMTKRAKSIINRNDPQALIVSAAALPRPSSGGMTRSGHYLDALAEAGWPVDILNAHIYPEIGKPPARWDALILLWRQALARHRAPKLPLWVTETNYNLLGGPMPLDAATRAIKQTNFYADRHGVVRVYWYAAGEHNDPKVLGIPMGVGSPAMKQLSALF